MSINDEILKELKKVSKILIISNGKNLEEELSKYATSEDRKKIWVLINGKNQSNEIALTIGITKRAVDIFLKILEDASLIERPYNKPPIRILDYVPAEWASMVQTEIISSEEITHVETTTVPQNEKEEAPNG